MAKSVHIKVLLASPYSLELAPGLAVVTGQGIVPASVHEGQMITLPRLVIFVSLCGIYYLNHKHSKTGFLFFAVGALGWVIYDIGLGAYEQAGANAFSFFSSLYGYWKWSRDGMK